MCRTERSGLRCGIPAILQRKGGMENDVGVACGSVFILLVRFCVVVFSAIAEITGESVLES